MSTSTFRTEVWIRESKASSEETLLLSRATVEPKSYLVFVHGE